MKNRTPQYMTPSGIPILLREKAFLTISIIKIAN
jgi:hypothetical protein